MKWPLLVARLACGDDKAHSVIEPLLADWQREFDEARAGGTVSQSIVACSGSIALLWSLAACAINSGVWSPPMRASWHAALAFIAPTLLALAPILIPNAANGELGSMRVVAGLMTYVVVYLPASTLPALFVLRRDHSATWRHAGLALVTAALIAAVMGTITSDRAMRRFFSSPQWMEREYQRSVANDRAGRLQYPGTAYRQLKARDLAEREKGYARMVAMVDADLAASPLTWTERLQQLQPAGLALMLGVIGWLAAGLAPPTMARASLWWFLMLALSSVSVGWRFDVKLLLLATIVITLGTHARTKTLIGVSA